MRKNFNPAALKVRLKTGVKDRRMAVRAVLGTLLAANLAAAVMAFRPFGGSPEDQARQLEALRTQVLQQQAAVAQAKSLVGKVEKARSEGDQFLEKYTLNRRVAYSSIVAELDRAATQAGIKPKERTYSPEPVEDSETLSVMTVTAGFEGTYANLTLLVNLLDKSPRFLIVESLSATPQQAGAVLNVNVKLNTFVRDEAGTAL